MHCLIHITFNVTCQETLDYHTNTLIKEYASTLYVYQRVLFMWGWLRKKPHYMLLLFCVAYIGVPFVLPV